MVVNPKKQQQQWRGPDLLITSFEVTDPQKIGDQWEVTAIVTATFRRKLPPDPPRNIVFDVDGIQIGDPQQIGASDGRARMEIILPEPKSYIISVEIEGLPGTRVSKRITIKKEEVGEAPTELLVAPVGRDGVYDLTVTVLSPKGMGMPRRIVRIQDPKAGTTLGDQPTDEHGTYKHHVAFTDRERFITVSVLGTKLLKTVRLFGPR